MKEIANMKENEMKRDILIKPTRNYGIDMLRLLSMFFVVMLHVLGQGGVISNSTGYSYAASTLLRVVAYCAVNCYAIISGYVCYREEEHTYHYAKYLKFWLPVFIYNIGITICLYITTSGIVNFKDVIKAALPVTTNGYWYVNAYTALFFLMPWINRLIRKITKKELNQLVFILFVIFSLYQTFSNALSDTFKLVGGYDFAWLAVLYIVGAWIKKNRINEKGSGLFWSILICSCVAITWMWEIFLPVANTLLLSYMSVPIVLIAVGFVVMFSRFKLSSNIVSIVRIFAPAAFGVYLIHTQRFVYGYYIAGAFSWIADSPIWLMTLEIIGCTGLIFVVCLVIEKLRLLLFEVFKINCLINILERWLDSIVMRCLDKIGG